MPTEANRNTPLAIVVALMAVILVSLTFYSLSSVHQEVASSPGESSAASKASAPGYGESSSGDEASAPGYGSSSGSSDGGSSGDEASSDSEAPAPGYGQ